MSSRGRVVSLTCLTMLAPMVCTQENVTGSISVIVRNAFNLGETRSLNFGTLQVQAATNPGDNVNVEVVMPADGGAPFIVEIPPAPPQLPQGNASGAILEPGQAGTFQIENAVPFTPMRIRFPNADTLVESTDPAPNAAAFIVPGGNDTDGDGDEGWTAFIIDGPNAGQGFNGDAESNLVTNGLGSVSFSVGARLRTQSNAEGISTNYIDAPYIGSFSLAVEY